MSDEHYPGEADEAAADEASCMEPMTPHALTREQVESRIHWYGGENYHLYRDRWADELLAHAAALRQALAQQAQELAYWKQQAAHFTKRCAEQGDSIAEDRRLLDQQAQELESARELNRIAAVALSEKEQEVERLKHEKADLVQRNQILRTRPDLPMTNEDKAAFKRLEQQLAAMTAERDELQKWHDLSRERLREVTNWAVLLDSEIATLQATLAERERVIQQQETTIRGYRHSVDIMGRNHDDRKAERDTARQDAARLREALQFYADPQTYGISGGTIDRIIQDAGKQAQKALKGA